MNITGNYARRIKSWVTSLLATHKADASAHHIKYTDAKAVSAVATSDNYVKNTGDTITGTVQMADNTYIKMRGFDNEFQISEGQDWFGWYGEDANGNKLTWFGGAKINEGGENYAGEFSYWVCLNAEQEVRKLTIGRNWIILSTYLVLNSIRSGATQAGAGAVADEVWKTNAHATLPDNVLMIGV